MSKRALPELTPMVDDPAQTSYVRELLGAGRNAAAGGAVGYDFERGLAKHLGNIDAGAPLPDWAKDLRPQAPPVSATGTSLVPWLAAPLALGVVAVAVVLTRSHSPAPRAVPTAAPQAAPAAVPATVAPAAAPATPRAAVAPVRTTITLDPNAIETTTPGAVRGKHAVSSSASKLSASKPGAARVEGNREPALSLESSGSGPSGGSSKAAGNGDLFEGARPARGAQAVAADEQPQPETRKQEQAAAQPPAKPAVLDDARLEREMQMLAVAQHSLASDPQRALSLARQGEAEFKGSMFTEERQQVLLLALVQLGRLDEAKKLARPYLARYPHGPFSDRVRRALATGRVEH